MKTIHSLTRLLRGCVLFSAVLGGLVTTTNAAPGEVFRQIKIADGLSGLPDGTLANRNAFGFSCTSLGDLDGDGIPELVVGALGDDTANGNAEDGDFHGAVHVLFLNADGTVKIRRKIADGVGGLAGGTLADLDQFGATCTVLGDLDGDGVPELGVGADPFGEGEMYVLFLNSDGTIKGQQKIADGVGGLPAGTLADRNQFGESCASLGDLDGDGIPELVVGAGGDNTANGINGDGDFHGAVHVLFLNADGTVKIHRKIADGDGGLSGGTLAANDFFGKSCTVLGDLDGDGVPELAVGASGDDTANGGGGGSSHGAVYVLFLNANGTVKSHLKIADGENGLTGGTLAGVDFFGTSCSALGDLDGDGVPELAVGAREDGRDALGAVHILFLNADGTVKSHLKIADGESGLAGGSLTRLDRFGRSCTLLGDLDGDGIPELAVGLGGDDTANGMAGGDGNGAVYILSLGDPPLVVDTGLDEFDTPSTNGSGALSLREAIRDAKATGEFRNIVFESFLQPSTLPLTRGPLEIDGHSVAIRGGPSGSPTISGGGTQRIFFVDDGAARFEGLILADGNSDRGGGVVVENGGTVVLDSVTIRDCTASEFDGGIINAGNLTVRGCSFLENEAPGGGGIFNIESEASLRVVNATFFRNRATAEEGFGGAIADFLSQASDVRYATFVENEAPDGKGSAIFAQDSTVFVANSVFSNDEDTASGGSGIIAVAANDFVPITDFAPLGDYGGKTSTRPLLAGSSAIDAGFFLPLPTSDQRGLARSDGMPDLGAVEFVPPPPPAVAPPVAVANNLAQILKLKKKLRKLKKKLKNAKRKGQAAKKKKFKKKVKKLKKKLRAL